MWFFILIFLVLFKVPFGVKSGKIVCGKCGGNYVGQTTSRTKKGKTYTKGWYFCSNRNKLGKCDNHRIEQELIEKFVVDSLINRILNGKTIDVILNNIKIEYENLKDSTQTDDIKRRLKDIQKECDNIVDNIAKTGSDRLIARLEMLENTEKDLQEQLEFLSN